MAREDHATRGLRAVLDEGLIFCAKAGNSRLAAQFTACPSEGKWEVTVRLGDGRKLVKTGLTAPQVVDEYLSIVDWLCKALNEEGLN